jgi:hypothetical protein
MLSMCDVSSILSTLIFSPCVTVMNILVGTKRVCNCDSFQLGIPRGEAINATFTPIDGIQKQDASKISALTKTTGVDNSDMKLLVLSDRLRDCYSNHLRLRKHLYVDHSYEGFTS